MANLLQSKSCNAVSQDAASRAIRASWMRIAFKSQLIKPAHARTPVRFSSRLAEVGTSECGEPSPTDDRLARIEKTLEQLEGKIDTLLRIKFNEGTVPAWYPPSEKRILESIATATRSYEQIANVGKNATAESVRLKKDISEMAEGADKFIAGLQQQLTSRERDIFFDLIASITEGHIRRIRTYAEIGRARNITKQAVQKAHKKLADKHPSVGAFIEAIRSPAQSRRFSELSPTERRRYGVDSSYDHQPG